MTVDNEKIIVISEKSHRKGARYYFDFMDSTLLNGEEKILFLALKRYLDYSMDDGGTGGEVWPSIKTLAKQMGWERKKVIRTMDSLVRKKVVKRIRRGLTKSNLYMIRDYSSVWKCSDPEQVEAAITEEKFENTTTEEMIAELKKRGLKISYIEKESASEPAKVTEADHFAQSYSFNNDNSKPKTSQEAYSMEYIHKLYDYDVLRHRLTGHEDELDAVMDIIHNALNSHSENIRIEGENKSAEVVKSRLLKLTGDEIEYCLEQFRSRREQIHNVSGYMLTMLYKSKEQLTLQITNWVSQDKE